MKSSGKILIAATREATWAALANPDNRPRWQTGVIEARRLSGALGDRGFVCRIRFDGDRVDEIESITELRYPDLIACVIESARYRRTVAHNLDLADGGGTLWRAWSNTKSGAIAQLIAIFRRSLLDDNLEQDMERFKLMMETDEASKP